MKNGVDTVPLIAPPPRRPEPDQKGLRIRALVATFATCIVLLGLGRLPRDLIEGGPREWYDFLAPAPKTKPFVWSDISASKQLEFHDCFNGFQCAKLSLPLDYFNGTHPNETVSIAIVKVPAEVKVNDPRYAGPILINPGGPGGSGTFFNLVAGRSLQNIVDSDSPYWKAKPGARYYDIIGFDPRGVGETRPKAACMPDVASEWSWILRETEEGILGSSDAALGRHWSMTHAWGSSCKDKMEAEDGPNIMQYMTTAAVARDMLEIVEKHATYVAERLDLKKPNLDSDWPCLRLDHTLSRPSEAKLNYWGFSYGTFLGATFSSMFPDRVGRVILDGVVSSYDYTHSLGDGSLADNHKVVRSFYSYCLSSGPEQCPMARANSTLSDIEDRVQSIIKSLYHNPIPMTSAMGPEIFTYSDMKALFFSAAYSPVLMFPVIAQLLSAIEAGGGDALDQVKEGLRLGHVYSCPIDGSDPDVTPGTLDPTFAILCSDGLDQTHVDIDEFKKYWDLLESISPTAGAIWANLKMRCAAWKIKASYKFDGPFGGNTSNPILFISNTADPVTPLRSGRLMHSYFPNSSVLISDHAGHCSISYPSVCLLKHIQEYFQTGKVPEPNTLCIPPPSPFSLNSTDPKSPFYDPSLDPEKTVTLTSDDYDSNEESLYLAGYDLRRIMVENDLLGLGGLLGGRTARHVMKRAAMDMANAPDLWEDIEIG